MALAHTKVSYATIMRQPRKLPGMGAAVRPFGRWQHPWAALGCSGLLGRLWQQVLAAAALLAGFGRSLGQRRRAGCRTEITRKRLGSILGS